ncbi:MAG: dephospho-CoA kinase [Clostridia bacterium]|nr:dephospho-CoA kinase [Clostridia bacterium]
MSNLKIAVTGGIGSGKSQVLNIIRKLGYKTVSLDEIYAQLLREKEFVLNISNAFSIEPIIDNECYLLDKKALSNIVFNDENALKKLNKITHSAIFERAFLNQSGVVFYEVPLLFEGNYQTLFDKIIVVCRNKKDRIESAIKRDGATEEQILAKINNQVDYDKIDLNSYQIIDNNGDYESLNDKVVDALKGIL